MRGSTVNVSAERRVNGVVKPKFFVQVTSYLCDHKDMYIESKERGLYGPYI